MQDSWRLRPNLTAQRRPALAGRLPVPGRRQRLFDEHDGRPVRRLRASATGLAAASAICSIPACSTRAAGRRSTSCTRPASPGYNTEYDNFAPNVGVAWQPNVQSGWLRTILGDPAQATIRASYGVSYNSDGLGVLHGTSTTAIPATRSRPTARRRARSSRWCPPASPGRCCCAQPERLGPSPGIPAGPSLPDGDRLQQRREPVSSELQDAVRPVVFGRLAADDQPADGDRSPLRRHAARRRHGDRELERGELDDQRIPRRVQAGAGQPAGQHGVGRGRARNSFAYFGPGTGTSPLPIYLANFNGRPAERRRQRRRSTPAPTGRTRRVWPSWRSAIRIRAARRTRCSPPRRSARVMAAAGYRATSSSSIRTSATPTVRTNGESTKYDSLQINLRRALSDGLAIDANYMFAKRYGVHARHAARGRARSCDRPHGVPHALKMTVHLRAAVRPRQAIRRRHEPRGSTPPSAAGR